MRFFILGIAVGILNIAFCELLSVTYVEGCIFAAVVMVLTLVTCKGT